MYKHFNVWHSSLNIFLECQQTNKERMKLAIAVTQRLCSRKPTMENEKLCLRRGGTHTHTYTQIHRERPKEREKNRWKMLIKMSFSGFLFE